jgi:DNA-binding FadR family transcriptional regulator
MINMTKPDPPEYIRAARRTAAEMAATEFGELLGTPRYPVGAKIAAVREIRDACGVSDSTAYEALKILEIRRRLSVQHGMRSVVLEPPTPELAPARAEQLSWVRNAYEMLGDALERLEAAEVIKPAEGEGES